jgi:hypothetical protein
MTDKQMIIDGVNVLNCGHYSQFEGETENACYVIQKTFIGKEEISKEYCSCETNSNCYYKQLKRKEQECERLRKEIRLYDCIEKWGTKECHCACRYLGNEFCDDADKKIKQLKAENEELKKINKANAKSYEKHWYKLEKYKQALQEIKEIAEEYQKEYLVNNGVFLLCNQILQKCEVLKDE